MQAFLSYRVAEAMTARPITVGRAAPLAEIFETHDFNSLAVVDRKGRLLGVVSKVDVLKAVYEAVLARPASDVTRSEALTLTPSMPLARVLRLMIHTGHRSFSVVDGDRLLGMIAREDVLRALRCAAAAERPLGKRALTG